jgi:CHASE2 domain-containing sensor protein
MVVKDKIVVIGTKTESVKDFFFTSFSRSRHFDQQISGAELHAHIISQLLDFGLQGKRHPFLQRIRLSFSDKG